MRAEYREAENLLHEIIRKAPNVPDPYQLLAQIYEDEKKLKKARHRCIYTHTHARAHKPAYNRAIQTDEGTEDACMWNPFC
jgi:Tfp pilus assembly protein PilF